MIKRVCFFVSRDAYDGRRYFTQKFADALQRKGVGTLIFDAKDSPLDLSIVSEIRNFSPDLTCSFHSLLPMANNKFLWDVLEIPHWSILYDPSLYSLNLTQSPYSILSCADRGEVSYLKDNGVSKVFFFPHAVDASAIGIGSDRPYDVVFLGSCYDYESVRYQWQKRLPEKVGKVLDEAVGIIKSDDRKTVAEALSIAWANSSLDSKGVDFISLYFYLETYIRGKDRVDLIRSVTDAPVHVFGEMSKIFEQSKFGWEHYLKGRSNVTIHPPVSYVESANILHKAKICLNSMPFSRDGTHPRVLKGLACGAFPITSYSLYLKEQFKEGENFQFYHSARLKDVNGMVNNLLSNHTHRQEGVIASSRLISLHHTWDKRAEQALAALPTFLKKTPVASRK